MDFLKTNPTDYPQIEYGLVDPSCSGSGMLEDFENTNTYEADRLQSLSNFQCMILRHAMKFPNMKRVVYSTCSVHKQENEEVVRQVLEAEPTFQLVPYPLPLWPRRGFPEYSFGNDVIRADPKADRMNGFFVACFEKI
jgi:putative methyltransferase